VTPHIDRIESDELAILAEEFRSAAARWRSNSDASRLIGRPTQSVRQGTRAWAYDEAARCCQEQLEAGQRSSILAFHRAGRSARRRGP
jgi:hypothetical protein